LYEVSFKKTIKNALNPYSINIIKGTVGVIFSDPPCKEGDVRFTTVPFNFDCLLSRENSLCKFELNKGVNPIKAAGSESM